MSTPMLPEEFSELEPFAATWCLETEKQRFATRIGSTMEEMHAFYDAAFPRIKDAMRYLDEFDLDALDGQQLNLLRLVYSVITVSLPVEAYGQPRTPDSGNAHFDRIVEPAI
ncbi:hypothetical protein [Nocardia alni]|uniref:hypothetical protein n=1 Tax=Nocardia alni TaxID=2815723 RepID=UPI001C235589|nr:hypothetical protein [Nocardia alni]